MRRTALAIALVLMFAIDVGGYFVAVSPAEASISELQSESSQIETRIASDETFIRDFPKQQAARRKQLSALRPINLHASSSAMLASFVADLDKSVRKNGIGFMNAQISSSAASAPAPVGSPNPNATPVATLVATAVRMTIRGTYAQILTAIAATSRASTLASINQVSFKRHTSKDPSANPALDADMDVTLYSVLFPAPGLRVIPVSSDVSGSLPAGASTGASAPNSMPSGASLPQVKPAVGASPNGS